MSHDVLGQVFNFQLKKLQETFSALSAVTCSTEFHFALLWQFVCYIVFIQASVLAFSTQVREFKPGRSRRIFKGGKILSTPSLGGEVKPSVPCRRFTACRISLNGVGSRHFGKTTGQHSRPQFPLLPLGSLTSWRTWRHLVVKSGNI